MTKEAGGMPKRGVPGNAAEESRLHGAFVRRVGVGWLECARQLERLEQEGIVVYRVSLKGSWTGHDELLVVLVAEGPEGPIVGFHGSDDVTTLWSSLARRISQGKMKWKVDEYAG